MNKYRKKLLLRKRICPILLLTIFAASSAQSQTSDQPQARDDRSDATTPMAFVSPSRASFKPSAIMPANGISDIIDQAIVKEFDKAWYISGGGTNGREGVVLIFRMADGSYTGKLQHFTNQHRKATFKWNPAAVAIVHTHPNSCDPKPADQDKRVADKYGIPNFTITLRGMYVYDPATKKTSKVMDGLDWLNLSTIQMNSRHRLERRETPSSGS